MCEGTCKDAKQFEEISISKGDNSHNLNWLSW